MNSQIERINHTIVHRLRVIIGSWCLVSVGWLCFICAIQGTPNCNLSMHCRFDFFFLFRFAVPKKKNDDTSNELHDVEEKKERNMAASTRNRIEHRISSYFCPFYFVWHEHAFMIQKAAAFGRTFYTKLFDFKNSTERFYGIEWQSAFSLSSSTPTFSSRSHWKETK